MMTREQIKQYQKDAEHRLKDGAPIWHAQQDGVLYPEVGPEMSKCEQELNDPVNNPPHYNQGDIECIDAIKSMLGLDGFIAYLRGNIAKYNWRLLHKGKALSDAQKLEWYNNRLKKELGEGNERESHKDSVQGKNYSKATF